MPAHEHPARFSRRYWFRLLRFLLIVVLIGALVVFHGLAVFASYYRVHPRNHTPRITPAIWDIPYEDVILTSADGTTVYGWYIPPTNGAVIILLHGHGGNRTGMIEHAAYLFDAGYGSLLLDARSHGMSQKTIYEWGGQGPVDDVLAGVEWLDARDEVTHIGALGMSMGGMQAIQAAAQDKRIEAVIADGPSAGTYGDIPHDVWPDVVYVLYDAIAYAALDYYANDEASAISTRKSLAQIAPRPALLIAGELNRDEPNRVRHIFESAGDNAEYWGITDAGHTQGLAVRGEEYVARITGFFDAAFGE